MRIGALIALERSIQLQTAVESGIRVDCEATPEMLETISSRTTRFTMAVVYFIYESGFRNFHMGLASAASLFLFLHRRHLHDPLLPDPEQMGALPMRLRR